MTWREMKDGLEWCYSSDEPELAERIRIKGGRLVEKGFEYQFDSTWPNMIVRKSLKPKKVTTFIVESKPSRIA